MKKIIASLLLVLTALFFVVHKQADDTVVIYSALEQYRNDELQTRLDETFPDINTQVVYMPTAKAAAKIQNEGSRTDADILLAIETSYLELCKDYLGDAASHSHIEYIDGLNPEHGKYTVWEAFDSGIVVNYEILEKLGLPEPQSYEDLLKPEYKGLIAMADPKSSNTGYILYLNLTNEWGLEKTLEFYDKLNENVKQYTESGFGPVKLMMQGEAAIGMAHTYPVVTEINNGHPLKLIYPEQGAPYAMDGLAFLKGREKNPTIMKVYEYIANDFILYDKENFNPGKILKNQGCNIPNYPKDIKLADMTGLQDTNLKKELLSQWKY